MFLVRILTTRLAVLPLIISASYNFFEKCNFLKNMIFLKKKLKHMSFWVVFHASLHFPGCLPKKFLLLWCLCYLKVTFTFTYLSPNCKSKIVFLVVFRTSLHFHGCLPKFFLLPWCLFYLNLTFTFTFLSSNCKI